MIYSVVIQALDYYFFLNRGLVFNKLNILLPTYLIITFFIWLNLKVDTPFILIWPEMMSASVSERVEGADKL